MGLIPKAVFYLCFCVHAFPKALHIHWISMNPDTWSHCFPKCPYLFQDLCLPPIFFLPVVSFFQLDLSWRSHTLSSVVSQAALAVCLCTELQCSHSIQTLSPLLPVWIFNTSGNWGAFNISVWFFRLFFWVRLESHVCPHVQDPHLFGLGTEDNQTLYTIALQRKSRNEWWGEHLIPHLPQEDVSHRKTPTCLIWEERLTLCFVVFLWVRKRRVVHSLGGFFIAYAVILDGVRFGQF